MKRYICFLLCFLLLSGMSGCGQEPSPSNDPQENSSRNNSQETSVLLRAGALADGKVSFFLPNGEEVSLATEEDIADAFLTADRKHAVLHQYREGFSIVDLETMETAIWNASDKSSVKIDSQLRAVKNDGVVFGGFVELYIQSFNSKAPVTLEISRKWAFVIADGSITTLYKDREGNLCKLVSGSDAPVVVSKDYNSSPVAISNNGELVVYQTESDNITTASMVYKDKHYDLGTGEPAVVFTQDQKLAVVIGLDRLWLIQEGQEPQSIKVSTSRNHRVFTENGDLSTMDASEVSGFYVRTADHVEYITLDGDWAWILDAPGGEFYIENGVIAYVDKPGGEGNLYWGKIQGKTLSEIECVAESVVGFQLTDNGKYLYYSTVNNQEDNTYSLYCLKHGTDKALEVDKTDFYAIYDLCVSEDGSCAFYFDGDSSFSLAGDPLKMWSYAARESKVIAENVSYTSITTEQGGFISREFYLGEYPRVPYMLYTFGDEGFTFARITNKEPGRIPTLEWLHFDGTEITQIFEPVADLLLIVDPFYLK